MLFFLTTAELTVGYPEMMLLHHFSKKLELSYGDSIQLVDSGYLRQKMKYQPFR